MAVGLLKMVKSYKFIATLYMLCDLFPHLPRLSCMFQAADVDLSQIQSQVTVTLTQIRNIRDKGGKNMHNLRSVLTTSLKDWDITPTDIHTVASNFKSQLIVPYFELLEENLKSRFTDAGIIGAFSIFDPKILPKTEEELIWSR